MPEATLYGRPQAFERGDRVFLTTPLTLAKPTVSQIDEYAFASAVKSAAPNEHIGWLQGRYVEAGRANLNGAMWLNDELALKSLTPMLMPVTVMHDPRTAVGTIADCKLFGDESASTTSRIDTILACWKHRFPDTWEEAEANIKDGTMMQSMECMSPSYTCSECGQQFIKLHEGKEQDSWCDHLRSRSGQRILQDVCFTGTGLIFGTRGGQGAYTEAHLDHFQDEIAEYHAKAHVDSTYRSSERSAPTMGRVEIEESELATLRTERNDAKRADDEKAEKLRTLEPKLEKAEADLTTEKERADKEEKARKDLEEKAQGAMLKDKRIGDLGQGFLAKLGDFSRERLNELASTLSDEDWDVALREREELAGVKRDTKASTDAEDEPQIKKLMGEGKTRVQAEAIVEKSSEEKKETAAAGSSFSDEEVAKFARQGVTATAPAATNGSGGAARQLARAFGKKRQPAVTAGDK
jgi:hypothetical protein